MLDYIWIYSGIVVPTWTCMGPIGALGDSLGSRARAHWAHSFVGPKGLGPIGPFLGDSFEEVNGF